MASDPIISIYYEHPDWFRPLFSELDRRDIPWRRAHAGEHRFDPGAARNGTALIVNPDATSSIASRRQTPTQRRSFMEPSGSVESVDDRASTAAQCICASSKVMMARPAATVTS